VRAVLHSVYDQPDADSVGAQHDRIIDALSDELRHSHFDAPIQR